MNIDKKLNKYSDSITKKEDIFAEKKPTMFFKLFGKRLLYLLSNNPEDVLSKKGVQRRQKFNSTFKKIGKLFLTNKQVIENRKNLICDDNDEEDNEIVLPDKPVIWVSNHGFKDDALATLLAMKRNGYILFGSLATFYQCFDGITAWMNGVVMMNRKAKESRLAAPKKMVTAISEGADLLIYPEGVWNKTPHQLMLDIYPGVYRIAKETGAQVVPIVHYFNDVADKSDENKIHTVVDDPISVGDMSESEFCEFLRNTMCTWLWLMMEKYGKSTRKEVLEGFDDSKTAWEKELSDRSGEVLHYDREIELSADYRPKSKPRALDIYRVIANVEKINVRNAKYVVEAKNIFEKEKELDFQRRF